MILTGRLNWAKLLSACLILSVTSACETASTDLVPKTVNGFCSIIKPIRYDSFKDTPETVKQIEALNSQWICICEFDCPEGVEPYKTFRARL